MMHLYLPPSSRRFEPRRVLPGASWRFAALEYDLVEALRPKLVVDLGAGDAVSFFTFCQSMQEHDVDGVCYAVDPWPEAPGAHPEASLEQIRAYGRANYHGLTYFVQMHPPEALRHFPEDAIDLLRVDGTRDEVIGGADLEAWFRRVRPGGLVAWYGAGEGAKLWSWMQSRGPSATFRDARGGLGLVLKPGVEPAAELLRLLFVENEAEGLERFYSHVHEHHHFRRVLELAEGRPGQAKGQPK